MAKPSSSFTGSSCAREQGQASFTAGGLGATPEGNVGTASHPLEAGSSQPSSFTAGAPGVFDALAALNHYRNQFVELRVLGGGIHGQAVLLQSPDGGEQAVSKQVPICGISADELTRVEREVCMPTHGRTCRP